MKRRVKVKELTLENFNIYGTFANMINPKAPKLGEKPAEFFRDMVLLNLGHSNSAAFSVVRVQKRTNIIDAIEIHRFTS